jgi:hypothetical protein
VQPVAAALAAVVVAEVAAPVVVASVRPEAMAALVAAGAAPVEAVAAPVVVAAARPEARAALVAAAVLAEEVAALAVVAAAAFPVAPEAESAGQCWAAPAVRPAAHARDAPVAAKARRWWAPSCLAVLPQALGLAVVAAWVAVAEPMASDAAMRPAAKAQPTAEVMPVAGSILAVLDLEQREAGACRGDRARSCQAAAAPLLTCSAVSPCSSLDRDCAEPRRAHAGPRTGSARAPRTTWRAQLVPTYLHRTGHALRCRKDARTHAIGRNRRAAHARDVGGRDPRINREARPVDGNGAIDNASSAQKDRAPIHWHKDVRTRGAAI